MYSGMLSSFTEAGNVWMVPSMYDGSFSPLPLIRKRNCASAVMVARAKRMVRMITYFESYVGSTSNPFLRIPAKYVSSGGCYNFS